MVPLYGAFCYGYIYIKNLLYSEQVYYISSYSEERFSISPIP